MRTNQALFDGYCGAGVVSDLVTVGLFLNPLALNGVVLYIPIAFEKSRCPAGGAELGEFEKKRDIWSC